MLFQIIFTDGTTYSGGDSFIYSLWKEISLDKKIRTIFYTLPTGDMLALSNFDRIYHYTEALNDLNGEYRGQLRIQAVYLIVERKNKYLQYKINQLTGNVEFSIFDKDNEYIKKLNPEFWKN